MASKEKKTRGTAGKPSQGKSPRAKNRRTSGTVTPRPKSARPETQDDSMKAEFIRRFKANPFIFVGTIVILVIVIVAFVFVPAIVPERNRGIDLNFGSYNKIPINYVDGNYFYQVQQSLARQYQSELDESNYQIANYQIWREAFEVTVVQTAMLDEMKSAGYTAPSQVVDRAMAQYSDFQENGRFSAARYRQMDSNQRMAIWRQVRDSIMVNYFVSDILGLKSPPGEGTFISTMASPQRSFEMVSFPISSYPNSEIADYVRANPSLFRITHLSKITINSEREARQIYTSVQDGNETFEDAARNKSRDYYAENSGDMGSRMVFELLAEIPDEQAREEVINLPWGSLSNVIRISDNTWALFRIEEPIRPADTNDAVIMDRIRNYIMDYERGRAEDWVIGEAENFIASANETDFSGAAADRAMDKQFFGPLPLNYGDVSFFTSVSSTGLSDLSYAGYNDMFWQACYATPLNTISSPIVIGSNVLVIYPLEEINADEDETGFIRDYYTYWLSQSFDQDIRSYFLNNGKLDDRFWERFSSIFLDY